MKRQKMKIVFSLFIEASFAYKDSHYAQAISKYEEILKEGFANGNLYYNLANSYFKKQDLGQAALNYERAMLYIPRDSDLHSNYEYVRSLLNINRQEMPGNRFQRWIDRLFSSISINGLTIFLSCLYFMAVLLLSLNLFFKGFIRISRPILLLLIPLFLVAALSLGRKVDHLEKGAIVISRQAEVKFEPLATATTFFKLSEGSLVEILEKTGSWYKIKRSDGKLGWVDSSGVEPIKG